MRALLPLSALLVFTSRAASTVVRTPATDDAGVFELLILHNNDMHARFEQTSQLSGACTTADREAGKCYGGFPRVAHVVKEARKAAASGEGPPVLYLNAGDTYTGTAWFTIYKWKIAAEFVNALQPDAVSLGNHEFDETVDGVVPFIRNLSASVLAANLILDDVPKLKNEPNLMNSVVIDVKGEKIGIIGYLTPDTKFLAPKNKVMYEDEVIALRREVAKLKEQGIKIFIALGHSGFLKDLQIARDVEDIDLVIGGHSNTFLWNGPTNERPETVQGPYPTIVEQTSGRKVLVVQAYAYTKYMGSVRMVFDSDGEIISFDGTPILLNQTVHEDEELLDLVNKYRSKVDAVNSEVVGSSTAFLDAETCRLRECNIGNVITDAIVYHTQQYYKEYFDAKVAIVQGGRIRSSIERQAKPPFELTRGDWITVLPFSDTLSIVTMNGTVLRRSLEHSVASWRTIDTPGQFIQFSGMKVTYDLSKPPGSRVVQAEAMCPFCDSLNEIQASIEYKVIMPSFLADDGDGYSFDGLPKETVPYNEVTAIFSYLKKHSPISPKLSERIIILNEDKVRKDTDLVTKNNSTQRKGRANSATIVDTSNFNLVLIISTVLYYVSTSSRM